MENKTQQIEDIDLDVCYYNPTEKLFYCAICESSFDKLKDLREHLLKNGFCVIEKGQHEPTKDLNTTSTIDLLKVERNED